MRARSTLVALYPGSMRSLGLASRSSKYADVIGSVLCCWQTWSNYPTLRANERRSERRLIGKKQRPSKLSATRVVEANNVAAAFEGHRRFRLRWPTSGGARNVAPRDSTVRPWSTIVSSPSDPRWLACPSISVTGDRGTPMGLGRRGSDNALRRTACSVSPHWITPSTPDDIRS